MENFINYITQEPLQNAIITGYVDSATSLVFHPLYERLFFIFNDLIYEVYLDNGLIKFSKIDNIDIWFDIDEDDLFVQMSIYSQLFKTEQEINITKIDYSPIPFSNMHIFYQEGTSERELILDTNNFFGFAFL